MWPADDRYSRRTIDLSFQTTNSFPFLFLLLLLLCVELFSLCFLLSALPSCPILSAVCTLLFALLFSLSVLFSFLSALCSLLLALCPVPLALRSLLLPANHPFKILFLGTEDLPQAREATLLLNTMAGLGKTTLFSIDVFPAI